MPSVAVPEPTSAGITTRTDRVAAAVRTWQRHLVDLGGRNTLLWYRDLPSGTLDLTTAHPGGLAMLLAGRPTKLSDLVRESTALDEARRRVRTIRAKTLELHEERGLTAGYLAAVWRPGRCRARTGPRARLCCFVPACSGPRVRHRSTSTSISARRSSSTRSSSSICVPNRALR